MILKIASPCGQITDLGKSDYHKTHHNRISDKVYKTFRDFLDLLPRDTFTIYDDNQDELTVEEKMELF